MGIQGLLPLLKSIMSPIHIKELEGCCVAIDTYSWLHKGALSCSAQLCKALPTSRHIDYCMHRINMLRHYGVKPILVFDGGYLPMKSEQEIKRARSRKENLARAIEHESSGNSAAAYECYQKAVDISPAIAHELIQVLKREGIQYIVAPYEADAQMTFLAITKQVDAIITEDSDLIAFGCPRIIYKMDKFGQGVEFQSSKLQQNKDLNFAGFTNDMLLEMCILNGCDYLPSLPGVGPKRAHALISKFKTFEKVIKHLRYSSVVVPQDYEKLFKRALLTFRHQRVYDSNIEDIVHLSDLPDDIDGDLDFLGPLMTQQSVRAIAKGELDPITKLPFQVNNVQNTASETSYQPKIFRPESDKKKLDLPAQKNILTNYFCFASLEAKRQFKAPRVSPKCANLANESSPTARVQVVKEPIACKTNGSSKHSNDPVKSTDVKSSHNSMEIELTPEDDLIPSDAEQNPLEKSGNSFHKPCIVLRRNSYLQHMTADENDSSCISNSVALRSSYFLDKSDDNDSNGKSKKIIVRSSYFYHNKSSKTPKIDETGPHLVRNNSFVEDSSHDSIMKRKASPAVHTNSEECAQTKHARTETYTGADLSDYRDNSIEMIQGEEKFGCNIAHLGHYSDISGKSLDKFACTISSFKYKSSGSRASGLRAPLRDVNNTFRDRTSAADIDIGKFAYIPSNGKVLRGIRK